MLKNLLEFPSIYEGFQKFLSNDRRALKQYVKALNLQPDQRVLEVGCGAGNMMPLLPAVEYTGVDINPRYIEKAQRLYGDRGTFVCADASELNIAPEKKFDIVLGIGLLHHLSDDETDQLFSVTKGLLSVGGSIFTIDAVRLEKQHFIERMLIAADRGDHIRHESGYRKLAEKHFNEVRSEIRPAQMKVPYNYCCLYCS